MLKALYSLSNSFYGPKPTPTKLPTAQPKSPFREAFIQTSNVTIPFPSNVPSLPVEIIILIFEAGSTHRDIWISWSRVCRTWRWIAQMLLSRHIDLSTPALLNSFKNSIEIGEEPSLADLDNSLRIRKVVQSMELGVVDKAPLSTSFFLLPLCPNISEVRLIWRVTNELIHPPGLAPSWANLDSLRSLYLDVVYQLAPPVIFHVISSLPRLQVLGLNAHFISPYASASLTSDPGFPRPAPLTELHLPYPPPQVIINWLLSRSSKTLQVLDLGRTVMPESTYGNILRTYGRNLRSLASYNGINIETDISRQLINLEELIIRGPIAPGHLARLPPTLQHLSFDFSSEPRSVPYVMKTVSEVASRNGLLRSIGYPYAAHPKDIEILSEHCSKHGLLLRASDDRVPSVLSRDRLYEKYASHLLRDRK